MSTLLNSLLKQLGSGGIEQISSILGEDKKTTSKALEMILPSLISGLSRNVSQPEGAEALNQALRKDHDGGILDDILGSLGNINQDDGQGILGHIFGGKKERVESGLSKSTGLDLSSIVKLMTVVAPLVMGLLGRKRRENDLGADDLSQLLQKEDRGLGRKTTRKLSPILDILDSDKDGDVTDDLVKIGSGFLSRLFRRK